jgi:hypothetical protein
MPGKYVMLHPGRVNYSRLYEIGRTTRVRTRGVVKDTSGL